MALYIGNLNGNTITGARPTENVTIYIHNKKILKEKRKRLYRKWKGYDKRYNILKNFIFLHQEIH